MSRCATWAVVLRFLGSVQGQDCTFDYPIDPYTEYYGLNPDYTAYSSDDCKANCCADPTCDVWQYTYMPPVGGANCMWGVSSDYGDSGGVQYDGEQGRDDGGGGDPGGGGGDTGGGGHHHAKCIGPHCKEESDYGIIFVTVFGVSAVVYLVAGTYFGVQQGKSGLNALPNSVFWGNLGGLVIDGITFSVSGGKPVEKPSESLLSAGSPTVVATIGTVVDAEVGGGDQPTVVKTRIKKKKPRGTAGTSPASGSSAVGTERKKKKKKKKLPSAVDGQPSAASME